MSPCSDRVRLKLLVAAGILALLCSCHGAIQVKESDAPDASPEIPEGLAPPGVPAIGAPLSAPTWLPPPAAPVDRRPFTATTADGASPSSADAAVTRQPPPQSPQDTVESLLARAFTHLLARWSAATSTSTTEDGEIPPDRGDDGLLLARQLVALSFLEPIQAAAGRSQDGSWDRPLEPGQEVTGILKEAIELLLLDPDTPIVSRLIAAAFLEREGLIRERDDLLFEICKATPPRGEAVVSRSADDVHPSPPLPAIDAETAETEDRFRLRNTAFASRIDGPGSYIPLEAEKTTFQGGDGILVYGEFHGYAEITLKESSEVVYLRRFRASMRLVDRKRQVLDSYRFLERDNGTSRGRRPGEVVNFWFRYSLPDDLPPGPYKVIIDGEDLQGGRTASTLLEFRVEATD